MLCGDDAFLPVLSRVTDKLWWKPGSFELKRCVSCGLIATRPRPTPQSLSLYYEGVYDTPAARDGLRRFYEGQIGRLLNYYRLVTIEKVRSLSPDDHVIDVGCSYGHFLDFVRRARAVKTTGIDTDAASLQGACARAECDYHHGTLLEVCAGLQPATVITFLECLEHDPDPVATLRAAHDALEPGGLVVIEVPMWDGWLRVLFGRFWHPLFIPQHLVHFSKASLEATVRAAGLKPVHHQSMLFPSELTLSFRAALLHWMFGEQRRPRPFVEALLAPLLIALFWLVDLPTQFFLRLIHRTGHQTLIAQRS